MEKIYGIDLGTTNSAIAFNGSVIVDIVPSIVNFEDGRVGKSQEENYEATRSFKVDISLGREGAESIKASSLVLKELVKQVKEVTGEVVKDVVISVPAFFSDNQRQATKKAAEDIGLNVRALINEPTAAAIRYNKDSRSVTVVYDLGGGTFDVTVIDSRIGVLDVQATDGIIVGGDTLDRNIFKFLVKRMGIKIHRLVASQRVALEHYSRSIKHLIQKVGDVEVDLTDFGDLVTQHKMMFKAGEYVEIMKHTFKETIVQLKKVIAQSVEEDDDVAILLVGGSTRDPYLQEWIKSETQLPVNEIDYNQDLIVAEGASIYADMIANGEVHSKIIEVTRAISIEYQDGTSKVVIRDGEALPARGRITVRTAEDTDTLQLNIYQGDRVLASQNELIGTMIWNLGEVVPKGSEPLMIEIQVNLSGIITVKARRIKGNEQVIVLDRGKVT